jgi:peroxiredoxin Q/BCP
MVTIVIGIKKRRAMLEVGNEAPKFSALDQDGKTLSLADFLGSWVLFWWYSKASTPG